MLAPSTQVAAAIAQQVTAARGAALVVERQHQVVAVVGTSRTSHADVLDRLRSAWRGLSEGGRLEVHMGVSTECPGLAGVGHGFGEAVRALEHATAKAPVLALQEMPAFDYLVASAEPATRAGGVVQGPRAAGPGRPGGRRGLGHPAGVPGLRPERQACGRTARGAPEHGALPAAPDRRAGRVPTRASSPTCSSWPPSCGWRVRRRPGSVRAPA